MELQVMILDDEYIILDGLCSFPWSDYGYQVAATAKMVWKDWKSWSI